ncbi:oxidoreductase YqhD [Klebsiella variicola]|uniref:Oxidoreductase YqhD n=1 Tax=Klebsiella variicola TaxID=244366 RepID=A0A7H4MK71_KLEVA|nr:oxidoreductase YqhD [Klebsiella variicola]
MQDFIYHNPVKILFGHDQIPALAQEVPQDKKVMIVYGGGSVIKHGILQRVKGSLKNTLVFEFGGVEPQSTLRNPDESGRDCQSGKN